MKLAVAQNAGFLFVFACPSKSSFGQQEIKNIEYGSFSQNISAASLREPFSVSTQYIKKPRSKLLLNFTNNI